MSKEFSIGGQPAAEDPWTWGSDDAGALQHQDQQMNDWNTGGWPPQPPPSNVYRQPQFKTGPHHPPPLNKSASDFFQNVNLHSNNHSVASVPGAPLQQPQSIQSSFYGQQDFSQENSPFTSFHQVPPTSKSQAFFNSTNNNYNPTVNNNVVAPQPPTMPVAETENKEVAPPDFSDFKTVSRPVDGFSRPQNQQQYQQLPQPPQVPFASSLFEHSVPVAPPSSTDFFSVPSVNDNNASYNRQFPQDHLRQHFLPANGPAPRSHASPQQPAAENHHSVNSNPDVGSRLNYPPSGHNESDPLSQQHHQSFAAPTPKRSSSLMAPIAASSPIVSPAAAPPLPPPQAVHIPDNQELLPENRELLDTNMPDLSAQMGSLAIALEEKKVLPKPFSNDRNQYLETGQLSGPRDVQPEIVQADVNQEEEEAPPPGLHRLVTGQIRETFESQPDNHHRGSIVQSELMGPGAGSESGSIRRPSPGSTPRNRIEETPPPGLHRMVTGQMHETIEQSIVSVSLNEAAVGSEGTRQSSPVSSIEESEIRQRQSGTEGESEGGRRLVQGQSIGDETDAGVREIPGEAEPPLRGRVVLGQMGRSNTPPQSDSGGAPRRFSDEDNRRERAREREVVGGRMVVGERLERDPPQTGNGEDYRQQHRARHRHRRNESSYEEDERDYSSDRDRHNDDYKRSDRNRRRRGDHRSPEFRSDEDYEERRGYHRAPPRVERRGRDRDYSPDRDYHRDYYRDDHRRHRRYEGYRERDYDDDYYYRENRGSRPSSRTGSDYRRMADFGSRSRHYFHDHSLPALNTSTGGIAGGGGAGYEFNAARAYEDYLDTMRRVDPAGYAAWYNQFMANRFNLQQQQNQMAPGGYAGDRSGVGSGSNTLQRQHTATPQITEDINHPALVTGADSGSSYLDSMRLYTTAHVRAKFDGSGRLVVVDPAYPRDNEKATVGICQLTPPPLDADTEEFLESPGPFIPGVTHRNTVLQYLKKISDKAKKSSEKLLYDLIQLTVKGKGEVNGSDVAEMLISSYKESENELDEMSEEQDLPVQIREKEVIAKFRELLQQGNKAEALEWAIEKGAWGHALFLASKMDDRTHNNIMLRFANSIPHNDPLQTLYQLMSGNVPQASTCCADKKWSDWRPHLAMILGNPTGNPKIDRKAIIKLGDSLGAKGRLFAAQFCYLTAQVEFSQFLPNAKLVLLASSSNQEFSNFATSRAIMTTLCYEYGLKLRQPNFSIPTLQLYKLILATRLLDHGKSKIALQYCEMLANNIVLCGGSDRSIIGQVVDLSSRLKMLDPTVSLSSEIDVDPDWLTKLKNYYDSLPEDYSSSAGGITRGISSSTVSEVGQESTTDSDARNNVPTHYDPYRAYNAPEQSLNHQPRPLLPVQQPPVSLPSLATNELHFQPSYGPALTKSFPEQPILTTTGGFINSGPESGYWGETPSTMSNSAPGLHSHSMDHQPSGYDHHLTTGGGGPQQPRSFLPQSDPPSTVNNIIAGQQPVKSNDFFKSSEEQLKLNEVAGDTRSAKTTGSAPADRNSSGASQPGKNDDSQQQKSGWFGGIWDKLSMKPKNQMRLPDDKNPSIVWDQQKKRWVNLEGDSGNSAAVQEPPRMSNMGAGQQQTSLPTGLPTGNKYKLQKGKLMKSNYVDVMGGKNKEPPSKPIDGIVPSLPVVTPPVQTNFFVPPPVEGNENAPIDFISPAPMMQQSLDNHESNHKQQLSRCSSVSSLSREVQFYMEPKSFQHRKTGLQGSAPMMYNPSQFSS